MGIEDKDQKKNEAPLLGAATNKVVIKQSDGALYLEKAISYNYNFYMTHNREEAMVFDSQDQAKAFLHMSGRDTKDWITEPYPYSPFISE